MNNVMPCSNMYGYMFPVDYGLYNRNYMRYELEDYEVLMKNI